MRKLFLWVLTFGLYIPAFAQDPLAQKYAAFINPEEGRKHLSIIASDAFQGRETGTAGAKKAANYIAGEFKKLGLTAPVQKSYFQKVPLIETTLQVKSFIVNNTPLKNWVDFYISGNPASKNLRTKEIIFIGYGISSDNYDDLKNINITDKVVMVINNGEPVKNGISAITKDDSRSDWSTVRNKRIQFIRSKNPALILAVSPATAGTLQAYAGIAPKPAMVIKTEASKLAPQINISPAVADVFLRGSGKTYTELKASIDESSLPHTQTLKSDLYINFTPKIRNIEAVNVLGFLEGSDLKDEILVFSAHYDHIGLNKEGPDKVNNGADDDGSGTTGILEIAKAFATAKKEGHGPRRSILFLGNVGEEKGLLGSEWYSDNPVFPLSKTITDLNIDMIGRIDPAHSLDSNYCYLIGSDKLSTELHKISEKANATYTKLHIDYKYNQPDDPERIYYRSDHYNFAKHNIPIIFYFNGVHADYHQPGDEVSKINFNMLTKRAQLVFYTGWDLANRDKRPVVDVVSNMPNSR